MEEEGPRGDMTIQSGLSNSTESIDSMKALTAAIEAANAQVSEGYRCLHVVVASNVFPIYFHLKVVFTVDFISVTGPWTSQSACQQQLSQHPHPSLNQEASG